MDKIKAFLLTLKKIILGEKNSAPFDTTTLKKALKYIGRYKILLPVSILLAVISVGLTLYVPVLIGEAIDVIIGVNNVDMSIVIHNLILGGILVGITALCNWLMNAITITF